MKTLKSTIDKFEAAKGELKTAKKEYRKGYREGVRLCKQGRDFGRGNDYWITSSDYFKEGYAAGWQAEVHSPIPGWDEEVHS